MDETSFTYFHSILWKTKQYEKLRTMETDVTSYISYNTRSHLQTGIMILKQVIRIAEDYVFRARKICCG